ncbi:tyrosine-protein phosphatase [Novosphingobium sp. HR1a]|uniref:tyrosine-protein phosphatase n=1 Tax=Novosphingobium sp. HR1a TaxID=1395637 RepID=UPI002002CED3|nr:tyrosine-protein phosphatase [Novosphingobium sp. HR1a]
MIALAMAAPASARELATLTRLDADTVELKRADAAPAGVWISADTVLDKDDRRFVAASTDRSLTLPVPATDRRYVILEGRSGKTRIGVAERVLPLEQGSNFRDVAGYVARDGHTVKWDEAFRSGAMPLLTDADYALLGQLGIGNVVDLRSIEEREVAPDLTDDSTGAMFIANDYSLKPLMSKMGQGSGENLYAGLEKLLAPQFRSLIRRPQFEMPKVDLKDYPNNPTLKYYAASDKGTPRKPEPLYTPSGASHFAQFFEYLDQSYGGSEGYLRTLGFTDPDFSKLRQVMLDKLAASPRNRPNGDHAPFVSCGRCDR